MENLNNSNRNQEINYTDLILDLHKSRKDLRGKYINYIIHGINRNILHVDKLFYKSVISCSIVEHCFAVGLFLRLGANIERFYNGKNISIHIVERFYNYNEEIYIFLMTMVLLKGVSYNDFENQTSSSTVGDYFKTNGIQIFFPKNIKLANQRLMNLYMDKKLTTDDYLYQPYEIVENLNIKLIQDNLIEKQHKNCEDVLLQNIIDSCNFNLFITAFESTYKVTYFSIERICVELRRLYECNEIVLVKQLLEMLHYLQIKKIYIDEFQYDYISDIDSSLKYISTISINTKISELLNMYMKANESPMYTLIKLKFLPSYVYDLNDKQLENIKYKAIHYRIEKNGIKKVIDNI